MHSSLDRIPGYQDHVIYDDNNQPLYATLILANCRVLNPTSDLTFFTPTSEFVSEVIFPDTIKDRPAFFRLEIPYLDYFQQADFAFPWRTGSVLTHPDIFQFTQYSNDLEYHRDLSFIPVELLSITPLPPTTLDPNLPAVTTDTRLRLTDESSATYLLVRVNWSIPSHAISPTSYDYESILDRCNPEHTASVRTARHVPLYYHCVSQSCPYGVDYWLIPLPCPA